MGRAQTIDLSMGFWTPVRYKIHRRRRLERRTEEGKSPVSEMDRVLRRIRSNAEHVEFGMKTGGPPPKAKYYPVTDSEQYREGKVKRTPGGE